MQVCGGTEAGHADDDNVDDDEGEGDDVDVGDY